MELNKIHNIDCLEFMKTLPDKCIDLVLTDPPYGIGETAEKNATRNKLAQTTKFSHYDWDKQKIGNDYFSEIKRVSKNQIIFGGNYYGSILGDTSCYIVWDKENGENDFADCELAWTSFTTAVRRFKFRWAGMLQENMKNKELRFHPTQKPVEVMAWILKRYSKENELVFDPFIGVGTTAIACKLLSRNYIGCELSPEYVKIAEDRIKNISNPLF